MRCGAVIIDNRPINTDWLVEFKKMLPRNWEYMAIKNHNIKSLNDYNNMLTSKVLWEAIPFDKVLIFQQDSNLLRTGIEEFLGWDYIGAPWKFQEHGGNGGLSLRTKEFILKVIEKFPYDVSREGYEDVYFSNHIAEVGGKLAPRSICEQFSCESIFTLGTLGYHAIDKYLTPRATHEIRNQYK
jgi:hypothetical protein